MHIIAIFLVIGWIFGFFYFSTSGYIHTLLVLAVIAVVLHLIRSRDT